MKRVLIADDNKSTVEALVSLVEGLGMAADGAHNGEEAIQMAARSRYDLVITDLRMPKADGMQVLREVKKASPETLVIVVTAFGTIDAAVEAVKEGALDFVTKPYAFDEIEMKIKKAIEQHELRNNLLKLSAQREYFREEESKKFNFYEIIGRSQPMQSVFSTIEKVADSPSSILILGESGTGKEMVARAIHHASGRAKEPFIKVHCAAYAETLLESELFGHEKGAFTGAHKAKIGRFEQADGGTLFLDEIGEISPSIQVKLLRFLQDREFERVGGTDTRTVDVRFIFATNRNLEDAVKSGIFREDLYYRINVITIQVPPLRERPEDIPLLAEHFLKKHSAEAGKHFSGIDEVAFDALKEYSWPGNVRELENVIERSIVLTNGERITIEDLPPGIRQPSDDDILARLDGKRNLEQELERIEKMLIESAYRKAKGVKARAAELLGIERNRLRYKLTKYGIGD
jgi:two-component system, NtrC family, response regulator HydG